MAAARCNRFRAPTAARKTAAADSKSICGVPRVVRAAGVGMELLSTLSGQDAPQLSCIPLVLQPAEAPVLVRRQRATAHGRESWLTFEILSFAPPPNSDVAVEGHARMQVVDQVIILVQRQRGDRPLETDPVPRSTKARGFGLGPKMAMREIVERPAQA
jgi:hypothetical protein